jgi:hypothetical protein
LDRLIVLYNALFRPKLEYASVVWNKLTVTDSNKIENLQRKFASLCYLSFQFDILTNYGLILNCLNFRTLYSGRRHLEILFIIKVVKGKIKCHSIMDTVGIRVPTKQFSAFSVSSALRHNPSARCVIASNDIRRFLDIFSENDVSLEDSF